MKIYTFFIYRPIAVIIPLTVLIVLNFFLLLFLIPIMAFKMHLIWILMIPISLITLLAWYLRKLLLIKVIAEMNETILKISYEALFISSIEPTQINILDIRSVAFKNYLDEDYRLKIKYGNKKNQYISFVKSDGFFSVKDDFLAFSKAVKKYNINKR